MTASETALWRALRERKLNIRRQAPVGRYIADFIHHASALVIEIDGARHDLPDAQLHDLERDAWFRSQGYETLRIRDRDAYSDPHGVAERITLEIAQRLKARATLPPPWGKGRVGGASTTLQDETRETPRETPDLRLGDGGVSPREKVETREAPPATPLSTYGETPPSQPFPHRGGRALHASPSSQDLPASPGKQA